MAPFVQYIVRFPPDSRKGIIVFSRLSALLIFGVGGILEILHNVRAITKWVLRRCPLREDLGEVGYYRPRSPNQQRVMKTALRQTNGDHRR